MGAEYPNQILTIVIWGSARKLFSYKPEEKLKNKSVCITGKIEVFKNKPEICRFPVFYCIYLHLIKTCK